MIIGIDPGLSGCIVVIEGERYIDHMHMPTMREGKRTEINGSAVKQFLMRYWTMDGVGPLVKIERVNAMPGRGAGGSRIKIGATSAFNFGDGAGLVRGIVVGIGFRHQLVTPDQWKRAGGFAGKDKDATRVAALRLYPDIADLNLKAKGQALADAIFIARHGEGERAAPGAHTRPDDVGEYDTIRDSTGKVELARYVDWSKVTAYEVIARGSEIERERAH